MNENPNRMREVVALFLVLATAMLGVVSLRDRIGSFRPASGGTISAAIGTEDVVARLWEDPFGAVQLAYEDHATDEALHSAAALSTSFGKRWDEYEGRVQVMAVFAEATPFPEDKEVRLRLRLAVAQALMDQQWAPNDRTHIGYANLTWPRAWPPPSPFTNQGPPDAPAGTGSSNDQTRSPDDESSGSVGGTPTNAAPNAIDAATDLEFKPMLVPFEWFKRRGTDRSALLLLWLPEDEFADSPVERLRFFLSRIVPNALTDYSNASVEVNVIGPRSSDTLRRMATEHPSDTVADTNSSLQQLGAVTIYSPHATAPDAALLATNAIGEGKTRVALAEEVTDNLHKAFGTKVAVDFVNLQQTDEVLAWMLVEELELRGLHVRSDTRESNPDARIVLISEADTFYGRALPKAFLAAACASSNRLADVRTNLPAVFPQNPIEQAFPVPTNILQVTYLRGLDGRTARGTKSDADQGSSSAEERLRRIFTPSGAEAERENQFDYIQRLGAELKQIDTDLRRHANPFTPSGVRAVGVLGSDVYDKLTVIQGLSPKFPGAVFFTTDLDARLWDPGLRGLTRNLIVASSYDIKAPEWMAGNKIRPVFRDTYQTATWLAVREAIQDKTNGFTGPLPVIAEIGRHGPVQLELATHMTNELVCKEHLHAVTSGEHRFSAVQGPVQWIGLCLALGVPCGLLIYRTRNVLRRLSDRTHWSTGRNCKTKEEERRWLVWQQKYRVAWLLGSALVLAAATLFFWNLGHQPGGEPMKLTEGVSIWPTELVRLATLCLIGGLLFGGLRLDYFRRRAKLWRTFFAPEEDSELPEPQELKPGGVPGDTDSESRATPLEPPLNAEEAFRDALWYGDRGRRFKRVWTYTGVYLLFGVGLFILLGVPSRPFRGALAGGLDKGILILCVLGFVWLTCYAVDSACIARRMLRALAAYFTIWPDHVVRRIAVDLGFPVKPEPSAQAPGQPEDPDPLSASLEGLIDVRVAAEVTKEMGTRFYLPFIVMMLMLISRSGMFDNWPWPPALVLINVCSFLLVITVALMVRQAAREVRASALRVLDRQIFEAKGNGGASPQTPEADKPNPLLKLIDKAGRLVRQSTPHWLGGTVSQPEPASDDASKPDTPARPRPALKQLEVIRERILQERQGAYSRAIQDPAFLAMLIPTGGYGLFIVFMQVVFGG